MKHPRDLYTALGPVIVTIGLFIANPSLNLSASHAASFQTQTTIVGEYLWVGNPCTTNPCLPGIVYAVRTDNVSYHLTINGSWLWEPHSWDGYTPQQGDLVMVAGDVSSDVDVFGKTYFDIEVEWLRPARRTFLPLAVLKHE